MRFSAVYQLNMTTAEMSNKGERGLIPKPKEEETAVLSVKGDHIKAGMPRFAFIVSYMGFVY